MRGVVLLGILLPASVCWSSLRFAGRSPEDTAFPPSWMKRLRILADVPQACRVRVFRVGSPVELLEEEGVFLGDVPALPVHDGAFRSRYGLREEFAWEERLSAGTNRVFLPLRDEGLYAVVLAGQDKEVRVLVSVTRLGLLAKRSRDGVVAGVFDRMDGRAWEGVTVRFRRSDGRQRKFPETDRDGLVRLSAEAVRYADRLVAFRSNAVDVVPLPVWRAKEEPEWVVLAVPERLPWLKGEKGRVEVFAFRRDLFREYVVEGSFQWEAVWNGRTNRGLAVEGVGRLEIDVPEDVPAGIHVLEVRAAAGWTRVAIPVVERRSGGAYMDVKVPQVVLGRSGFPVEVAVRNTGHRRLRIAVLTWRAWQDGVVVEGRRRVRFWEGRRPRITVPAVKFAEGPVSLVVGAELPDGERLKVERSVAVVGARVAARLTVGRRLVSSVEPVAVSLGLSSWSAPRGFLRAVVELRPAGERAPEERRMVVMRPGVTNLVFYPKRTGPYEIVASVPRGRSVKETVWVIPDTGGMRGAGPAVLTDKDEYGYGEIARVLLFAPHPRWEGLLTFEGDTLFLARTVRFEASHLALDLPVTEANRPNAFLVLQSFRSNRLLTAAKRLDVPARHKRVYYDSRTVPMPGGRVVWVVTRNVAGRPIKVHSFVRVGGSGPVFWSAFPDLYGPTANRVLSCGRESVGAVVVREEGSGAGGWLVGPREVWPEVEEAKVLHFPPVAVSNRVEVREREFPSTRSVEVAVRSVGEDGKVGLFRTVVGLDRVASLRMVVPAEAFGGDRPAVGVGIRNMTAFERPVAVVVAFEGRTMLVYRTNRFVLGRYEERWMVVPFPEEMRLAGVIGVSAELRTAESVLREEGVTGWKVAGRSGRSRVRKSLRRVGGLRWGPLLVDEAVRVVLRSGRGGVGVLRDEVPAGFRPVGWSVREAGGWTDGRFVWFPSGRRVEYLMRAVVPGEWEVPNAVWTSADDRESERSGHPRRIRVGF